MSVSANSHRAPVEQTPRCGRRTEGRTPSGLAPGPAAQVWRRSTGATDGDAVARLAALDERRGLKGRVLLALLDGRAVAALSRLEDGRVVANPSVATADAVAILGLRAEQLVGRPRRRVLRHWPRLRLALTRVSAAGRWPAGFLVVCRWCVERQIAARRCPAATTPVTRNEVLTHQRMVLTD